MGKLERKRKEVKLVHPNSRKAAALVKQKTKSVRRDQKRDRGHQQLRLLAERLVWFRDNLEPGRKAYTPEEAHQLIYRYLSRYAAEMEQLRCRSGGGRGRPGRRCPPPARLLTLEATQRSEVEQYDQQGIECADLTDEEAVLYLRAWDGQLRLVPQIRTRRFIRRHLETAEANSASAACPQMAAQDRQSGDGATMSARPCRREFGR